MVSQHLLPHGGTERAGIIFGETGPKLDPGVENDEMLLRILPLNFFQRKFLPADTNIA